MFTIGTEVRGLKKVRPSTESTQRITMGTMWRFPKTVRPYSRLDMVSMIRVSVPLDTHASFSLLEAIGRSVVRTLSEGR